MSFDLAIWAGEKPAINADAVRTFKELSERYLSCDADPSGAGARAAATEPPDPRVVACKREITSVHSDGRLARFGSPWASFPLAVHGPVLYMNLRFDVTPDVVAFIARTAAKHDLVCFDPQRNMVVDVNHLDALAESYADGQSAVKKIARRLGWRG